MNQKSEFSSVGAGTVQRKCVVTGAAGFIGSRLTGRLLDLGWQVQGIDAFTDGYDPSEKLTRAAQLVSAPGFNFVAGDLVHTPLDELTNGAEVVFHLAGRAGVRPSFALEHKYRHDNVSATEKLLASCRRSGVRRVVYASSSSVYGNAALPFVESGATGPISPYGRTKLEAEEMCLASVHLGLEATALRYFTVYGPGQRPDMGIRIFAEAALQRRPIRLLGDGSQRRDFTFVDDIVDATIKAADAPTVGRVINVGGGSTVSLSDVLEMLEDIVGIDLDVRKEEFARGDVLATEADLTLSKSLLGFQAKVPFEKGLAEEVAWVKDRLNILTGAAA